MNFVFKEIQPLALHKIHPNITSSNYINEVSIDHIETYSLLRGEAFESNLKIIKPEYNRLKVRYEKQKLNQEEEERYLQLDGLLGRTQYLHDAHGHYHPSSVKINAFSKEAPEIQQLIAILRTAIIDVPNWMCGPVYRDAIIFYDHRGNIISTLNVCLSCQYMCTGTFIGIDADFKTYDMLKQFFIAIGHPVENQ